jgi:hypothetical protein
MSAHGHSLNTAGYSNFTVSLTADRSSAGLQANILSTRGLSDNAVSALATSFGGKTLDWRGGVLINKRSSLQLKQVKLNRPRHFISYAEIINKSKKYTVLTRTVYNSKLGT